VVSAGETAIVFYRLYNREPKPIVGFSVYNIYPEECNAYFSKIQCFCFNQQLINPNEELLLPIFFYIEPEINDDPDCSRVTLIKVAYTFLKSAKQNLAKFAEEELKRVEDNKKKLNEIRAQKMNMTLDSYLQYLDSEEAKNREEAELKHEQQVKNRQDAEIARLKHAREFDQDLLLAELISKEFDSNPEDGVEGAKEAAAAS
jgi:cytochrome c oxidase assembly protein subunit 11